MTLLTAIRVLALSCLVAGCGKSSKGHANEQKPIASSGKQPLAGLVPVVDGGDVLATVWAESGAPGTGESLRKQVPVLVIVDARGEYRAAAPPLRWQELGAHQPEATAPLKVGRMRAFINEGTALGRPPHEIVAELAAPAGIELDIPSDEEIDTGPSLDDPPPPEEEEESGGTGTAMRLEEGRMGKKDSERAEGQYKMRKEQEDPQLAAQVAKEKARMEAWKAKGLFRGHRARSRTTKEPARLSTTAGFIDPGEELPSQRAAIVAHPAAKAAAVVKLLAGGVGDSILVAHGKDVRPLRLQFGGAGLEPDRKHWIEVRAHQGAFLIEGVPGTRASSRVCPAPPSVRGCRAISSRASTRRSSPMPGSARHRLSTCWSTTS
jgi:hypothetical protein